jgi:hypothetical protein
VFPKYELGSLCAFDLQHTKNCGFYRFHKEYLQMLKDVASLFFDHRTGQTQSIK